MKDKRVKAAALKYTYGEDSAPKLTAKGTGKVAEKILDLAKKYDIPTKRNSITRKYWVLRRIVFSPPSRRDPR